METHAPFFDWENTTALVFVGFIGLLRQQVGKSVTVILHNTSIHKANSTRVFTQWLARQGMTLYFLPAYAALS